MISSFVEGLSNIGEQIIESFDSNWKTHKVILNTEQLTSCRWNREMSHESRVLSEWLNSSKRFAQSKDLQSLQKVVSLFDTTLNVKGNHCARTLGLLFHNLVLGMAWETWVKNLIDFLVALQKFSNSHSVCLGSFDSDFESLCSAQANPAVKSG